MRLRALVLAAPLLAAVSARAQTVQGRVSEATGAPAPQVLVVLLDGEGRQLSGALAGDDGAFALRAPWAGRFTLRAERVGYATTVSPPFDLADGQTVDERLTVSDRQVKLDAITVVGAARRCAVRPTGVETAAVWEEARKALNSAAYGQQHALFRYTVARFSRDLDPATGRVLRETRSDTGATALHPFASLPAARLSAGGWVQETAEGTMYYGPDPAVLVSDEFLDDHCLRLDDDRAAAGDSLIGVAFEPIGGRRLPDIRGVLWLDRRTAALRRIDYHYTGLATAAASPRLGGSAEYARVAGGPWVVTRWSIRMPQLAVTRPAARAEAAERAPESSRLVAIREDGGEVLSTTGAGGLAALPPGQAAAIEGVVWDSARAAPLAGARVYVSGSDVEALADSAGRFRLDLRRPGTYTVAFAAPAGVTTLAPSSPATLAVAAGQTAHLQLGTRGVAALAAAACPDAAPNRGALLGTVSGPGAAGATVRATWSEGPRGARTATATADSTGAYAICGVPRFRDVLLSAAGGRMAAQAGVSLDGQPALLQDLTLSADATLVLRPGRAPEPTPAAKPPVLAGFERRRQGGRGVFLTPERIAAAGAVRTIDLFRDLPGMRVVEGGAMGAELRFDPRVNPEAAAAERARAPAEAAASAAAGVRTGRSCRARYVVDGRPKEPSGGADISDDVALSRVVAVEIYRTADETPPAFRARDGSECGVVVIWTRRATSTG